MPDNASCRARSYLARPPEQLVVKGYRHWLAGCVTGSVEHWNAAWNLYVTRLGHRDGRMAFAGLNNFVAVLGRCAVCPLRFFPTEANCVCRDECLVLGLVAGIQTGDDDVQRSCTAALTCRRNRDEVMAEAGEFALTLRCLGQLLLPIPADAIADILSRPARQAANPTYH